MKISCVNEVQCGTGNEWSDLIGQQHGGLTLLLKALEATPLAHVGMEWMTHNQEWLHLLQGQHLPSLHHCCHPIVPRNDQH